MTATWGDFIAAAIVFVGFALAISGPGRRAK